MLELRHCAVILIEGGLLSQTVEGYAVTLTFLFPTMCISFREVISLLPFAIAYFKYSPPTEMFYFFQREMKK